jgi:hypothetical protein
MTSPGTGHPLMPLAAAAADWTGILDSPARRDGVTDRRRGMRTWLPMS